MAAFDEGSIHTLFLPFLPTAMLRLLASKEDLATFSCRCLFSLPLHSGVRSLGAEQSVGLLDLIRGILLVLGVLFEFSVDSVSSVPKYYIC